MKKLIASLLPVLFIVGIASAGIITVEDVQKTSSCNSSESHDRYYYIPSNSSVTIYPDDTFGNTVDSLISRGPDTSVQIWRHGVLSSCNDWGRISNVVSSGDVNGALIIRNDDGCVLGKPNYTKVSDPTAIDAQIHYTIGYRNIFNGGANTLNSRLYYRDQGVNSWTCYPGGNTETDSDKCPKVTVKYGDQKYHVGECLNYRVFWCGDGLVNRPDGNKYYANGTYTEECDPESPDWKNRADGKTCSATCKEVAPAKVDPVCSSTYNNKTKYTDTSSAWLSSSDNLCDKGEVKNFNYSGEPRTFTWDCKNDGILTGCTAKQERCGDGVVQQDKEDCDDGANNGTSSSSCSSTCKTVGGVTCGSKDKGKTYFDTKKTTPWLTKTSAGMCGDGLTVGDPVVKGTDDHLEWTCSNVNGSSVTCKAYQEYCGDGVKNGGEQCDYNDPDETNWGNDGCDQSCKQKIQSSSECKDTFYYTLRHKEKYTFYDKFIPGATRYLYDFSVTFIEKSPYDYNQGPNPSFYWMDDLGNGVYKQISDTRRVIKSSPLYEIKTHPDVRSKDNLYIEYDIKYADKAYSSKPDDSKLKSHKECVYYEISRCGDGVLDEDYNEECDPGSAGTSTLPDGRICNSDCKIKDAPSKKGKLKVEKTLISESKYVTEKGQELEWQIKVTAVDGDVKNVLITDKLPEILSYVSYTSELPSGVTMNSGQPTKSNNDKIIKWKTSGTLKEGKSIILKVKTKVEVMPKKTDSYNNVACAEADNLDEECKEVPIITPGKLKVEKTLISESKYVTEKGQELEWQIKVTAVDGDVENVLITDKLPEILSYVSYTSELPSGVTMNSGQPTKSNNDKIIKWQTSGTLKEGKSIILKVKTKVEVMPKKTDSYNNVACAEADNLDEECKEVPIPTHGKVEVEKTLISDTKYVTKVGQELEWQIKVTAVDGDVDNVWIEDELPEVLSYVSYTSDLPSGVTMNSGQPTKSNNGLHLEWQTSGTLKEGKSIILKVKTKVEIMPKTSDDYENVACAKADDVEEDCSKRIIPTHGTLTVEKKLISENKYVTKVEQELEWQIKVTAVDGDVDNVVIKDILPEILSYVSYTSELPSGVTMNSGQPTKSDNGKTIKWKTSGTLKEGKSIILKVKTKVDIMPKKGDDYENVACAEADDVDEDCQPVPIGRGSLEPDKTLVGSKEVKKVGDLVIWKLKVTAVGGDVENPIITDKLPPVLGYTGYIVTNKPTGITISNPTFGTKDSLETIEWKTTGILKENDFIEIQLTTYAKVMPDKEYKNVLCVKPEGKPEEEKCDDVPIPAPKLRIMKSFSDGTKEKTVKVSDEIEYKITFGNKGTASATITSIKDFLPKNVEYISSEIHITGGSDHTKVLSGSDVIYSNKRVDGVYIDIYGGITLEPGTEGYILLKGKILSDNKDNRTNFACIYLNDKKPDDSIIDGDRCADAVHKFDDGLLCGAPEITKKTFTSSGGSTSVVCKASGGKKANIELDCGNGATLSGSKSSILTGSNISSLTGTCVYPKNTSSSSKSYTVSCKVNGETGDSCKDKVSVPGQGGPGGSPKCDKITTNPETLVSGKDIEVTCKTSNGSAYILIDCNYKSTNKYDGTNKGKTYFESDGRETEFKATCTKYKLDTKIQCLVKDDSSSDWKNATVEKDCGKIKKGNPGPTPGPTPGPKPTPDPIAPMAECFDINANQLSYEQGEILPFYWNLDNLSKDDIWYLSGSFSDKVKAGEKCDGNAEGLVALNSMECSYDIVDSDGIVKKIGNFPCLTEENFTVNPFYQSRLDIGKNKMCGTSNNKCYFSFTTKATKTKLWSNLNTIPNFGEGWTRFGEYKIRMKKISYLRCNDGEWDSKEKSGESLCESTFMLTNPYTVQKTPSGNFRASTDALSKYRYCEKYEKITSANDAPKCLSWNNADNLLNAIAVSEYQPNDAVNKAMDKFINKYSKLAVNVGDGLKKVPGKNIYFAEGKLDIGTNFKLSGPTTIVQTKGDTTIRGNVNKNNLMLLTKGKIIFTDTDSCRNRQTVKGIFYAGGGIERTPVQKNKYDTASERCTQGGLTVKGVLIGNGLKEVMQKSRSNLNGWHKSKTAQTVMNGASVLIEYSPSVFTKSTMPPGAEDFTTALSIYKD